MRAARLRPGRFLILYVLAGTTPVLAHNNNDDLCDIARGAAGKSNTNNTGVAAARDGYTGEVRTGESGSVPGNVNPGLVPRLRQAQDMQKNGIRLEEWDPGTCAEFHAGNNLMNDVGANLDEIEYGTVRKEDGTPFPSCGWCRQILGGGGATDRTPG
ncbi:hypothetical protein [Micromonospora sp. DT31]|uniref:hypothetical protein n=1 Tax=Micromonospora sp. DT31 TaxID=3393434 RepID=UPI003CF4DA91